MTKYKTLYALPIILFLAGALPGCATYEKCKFGGCSGDAKITTNVQALFQQHPELGPPNLISVQTLDHLCVLMLTWTGGALAADSGTVSARPRTVNAAPCEACHGAHGEGAPAAEIPRLAGQSAEYLEKQLRDYADGSRNNPVMQNFAKGLSDSERAKLSVYYASLTAQQPAQSNPGMAQQLARGHQLAVQGDEAERVQACISCHGPDGSGVPHAAPYLAGQSAEYLASALNAWQRGTRRNDGGQLMASVAGRLSAADITAVSAYFSNLAP